MSDNSFCVIKRNGMKEEVSFDKVTRRIKKLCVGLSNDINPILVAQKVCSQIYNNVSTIELDELTAQICISMETTHLDYGILASRIIISNNQKCTSPSFSETIYILYNNRDKNGVKCPLIADDIYDIVMKNKDKINSALNYDRDYLFDYFGFKTLEKAYLMKSNGKVVERIQHLFMRVSLGIHKDDLRSAIQSYNLMSSKYFTHATPTLYNASTPKAPLASCFLLGMEDSVKGIYKTISDCAEISACAGGIGLSMSRIRSKNSYIRGTNGTSNGIVPLCRVLNETARHINQSGKRPGSIAVYIEPHNVEILEFLELKKNTGAESERARDLFLALWISDLFMKRVEGNLEWSLFDADECPHLEEKFGDDYDKLYESYEKAGKARKVMSARKIWNYILTSQIETGVPYIGFKDNVNKKNNQSNIGTIMNSNLCVTGETLILTDKGYEEIKSLEDCYVKVWNGVEFSSSVVKKTGENQKIIKILFSDGCELECTEYHKFYIEDSITKVDAKDLKPNMKLVKCNYPIIDINNEDEIKDNHAPINCSFKTKIDWLSKLFSFSNSFIENPYAIYWKMECQCETENLHVIIKSNKLFLLNIKLMLNTLGFNVNVKYNGINYELIIYNKELLKLVEYGVNLGKECDLNNNDSNNEFSVKVVDIIDENKYADTYCFNEPNRNAGIFNGIYAGNCIEILQYSDSKEYAVCTLASISLPAFILESDEGISFDYDKLVEVAGIATHNLNKIIDVNYYPVPETEYSAKRQRAIGLGIQGLANVYIKMRVPFDSMEAREINKNIMESIYYGAMKMSHQLAVENGAYPLFKGSPLSEGKFQFDLWEVKPSDRYDWNKLREDIIRDGVANSLLVALMPTASTSQILGNNECFEPITSNIYTRRTIAGDFVVINKYLVIDLMKLGLWNNEMKNKIIANNGSIQSITEIPQDIKNLYKTVWEIKQKVLIDQAIDRGPFVCQTQSMNLFFEEPTQNILTSALFHGWKNGLKTGSYYIRTKPKAQAQQFTIDPNNKKNDEPCEMCSA
jgi:ribonucleotide reductase alpha subunit